MSTEHNASTSRVYKESWHDACAKINEQNDRIAHLESIVDEVHSWAVCAAIADAQDMAQNFPRIVEITTL